MTANKGPPRPYYHMGEALRLLGSTVCLCWAPRCVAVMLCCAVLCCAVMLCRVMWLWLCCCAVLCWLACRGGEVILGLRALIDSYYFYLYPEVLIFETGGAAAMVAECRDAPIFFRALFHVSFTLLCLPPPPPPPPRL